MGRRRILQALGQEELVSGGGNDVQSPCPLSSPEIRRRLAGVSPPFPEVVVDTTHHKILVSTSS
ncbi:hypothetical protein TIFTF001_022356 [Ficus carica]|uniref:Uncharacterized protein n=1 Tax=Ficus carica TaxID=3494 RepID=A0AA88ATI1_FICCA|nr:hypothetical protein TIFTF001_022356 [Ficus carica]